MMQIVKLPVFLAMMGLGGWLLMTARRRPAGSGPHCMACGYNLAHLESPKCPECGAGLSEDTISDGPPSRFEWGRFWLGALLVFIPACWVVVDFGLALMRAPSMSGWR